MKPGNRFNIKFLLFIFYFISSISFAEDKITTSPLINLDKIKPSFEEVDQESSNSSSSQNLKEKKIKNRGEDTSHAILIGLDKITAKSSEIKINLNEVKTFGPLEIKILKCGKVKINNKIDDVAYMQVKDLSKNEEDKVFIFNGWTFSSEPELTPFDHAIYDLQLVNCVKV